MKTGDPVASFSASRSADGVLRQAAGSAGPSTAADAHRLERLSWQQVRHLDKRRALVVLPLGSTEQHGPHLPIATDAIIADRVLDSALAKLRPGTAVWRLPCLPYGKSNEHRGFPGTVSLSLPTFYQVIREVAQGVSEAGFQRLALFSGHGGNSAVMAVAARDLEVETDLTCFCIDPGIQLEVADDISERERAQGFHAGQVETSLMLALIPELVDVELAVAEFPDIGPDDIGLTGPSRRAWITADWSTSGVFGDATLASRAQGERLLEALSEKLAREFERMAAT